MEKEVEIRNTILFKKIIKSVSVREIHYVALMRNSLRCDWQDLACFPEELIRYKCFDRYKSVLNYLIINQTSIEQRLFDDYIDAYIQSLSTAATQGNTDLIEFHSTMPLLNMAIWQPIEFLHATKKDVFGTMVSVSSMDAAANNGHFSIVKFLHHNRTEACSKITMDSAFKRCSKSMK
ncbi:hypothetical protein PPL_02293 [Heterostelium album PN500]|uniref:Ankyrin repeat protein n=1 Tax=Heterostelium pallidum (strain ATCC 26659 / Pp 5 / PN500) TaxID=670386 RepID=D3B1W8_HETP5|nr:hypothetical protein PPL_02293 [Heterostelium album PN500]EFA85292.1 hypothetical protein PPL_02293 [Heterostelium album PN500]|eukprot:XP_020437401.1 hypothetical protein PPL_02293 [Heterostelium album PN500]